MSPTAFGLRSLRPGFAISAELDRAFALGWPNAVLELAADAGDRVRARLAAAGIAATEGAAMARAFGRHVIAFGFVEGIGETEMFELEHLVGADVLADQMIASLEEASKVEWKRAGHGARTMFRRLGFVLLRADAAAVPGFRARLEAIYEKYEGVDGPIGAALDVVLHGAAGARRAGRGFGGTDAEVRTADALFVDDDPALLTAIARGDGFDRAYAARLAFLGDAATLDAIVARWFAHGDAAAQRRFVDTVGRIAGDAMVAPTREAVRSSKIKAEAAVWLASRGVAGPSAYPRSPGAVDRSTLVSCDGDHFEFGFVILAAETAAQLRGEDDDHTMLAANADPTTTEATAGEAYGGAAAFFCLAQRVALAATPEGALVFHGSEASADEILAALGDVADRDWLPVTTLELPTGRLVGMSASDTLAGARAAGTVVELSVPPGRYDVRHARDEDDRPPLIWLARCG